MTEPEQIYDGYVAPAVYISTNTASGYADAVVPPTIGAAFGFVSSSSFESSNSPRAGAQAASERTAVRTVSRRWFMARGTYARADPLSRGWNDARCLIARCNRGGKRDRRNERAFTSAHVCAHRRSHGRVTHRN